MERPLLVAAAVVSGVLSTPSLLGWALLSIVTIAGGKMTLSSWSDLLGLVGFAAGWLGWASLLWLAANFAQLGARRFPLWVTLGLVSGIAAVAAVWAMSRIGLPTSPSEFIAALLFGGAPLLFATVAVVKHYRSPT